MISTRTTSSSFRRTSSTTTAGCGRGSPSASRPRSSGDSRRSTSAKPGATLLVSATVALHPLVRYGEVLRGLRDLESRVALAFPGAERGGRLHFMNQPDGGNYLAVKLFWR